MSDSIAVTRTKYGTIPTTKGQEKIAAAILNGTKVNITHIAVGDANGAYYYPTADQTALRNEVWRGEIAYAQINENTPNMIDIEAVIPADVGGFFVREGIAIDEDGDVVAVWNSPAIEKPTIGDGASLPLTIMAHIVVEDASAVTITVNPALDTISRKELDEALKRHSEAVGSAIIAEITIPVSAWVKHGRTDADLADWPYMAEIIVEGCTDRHFPVTALARASLAPARDAGMCVSADTVEGAIQFFAAKIPAAALEATVQLRTENLTYPVGGEGTGDGCECPGIATDEEVKDAVEEILGETGSSGGTSDSGSSGGYEIATDEEVEETIEGIFGK